MSYPDNYYFTPINESKGFISLEKCPIGRAPYYVTVLYTETKAPQILGTIAGDLETALKTARYFSKQNGSPIINETKDPNTLPWAAPTTVAHLGIF